LQLFWSVAASGNTFQVEQFLQEHLKVGTALGLF